MYSVFLSHNNAIPSDNASLYPSRFTIRLYLIVHPFCKKASASLRNWNERIIMPSSSWTKYFIASHHTLTRAEGGHLYPLHSADLMDAGMYRKILRGVPCLF